MRHAVFSFAKCDNSTFGKAEVKEIGNLPNITKFGLCSFDSNPVWFCYTTTVLRLPEPRFSIF